MEPVRIKYWGMVRLTRRAYLWTTTCLLVGIAALLVVFTTQGWVPPFRWPWEPLPATRLTGFLALCVEHFWTFLLVCGFAEAIDVLVTLRVFARREAEQKARRPQ